MNGGWYKQLRNITERAWFKDANMLQLYTFLKAMAYVTDGKYKGYIIRRGSCPTTRSEMAELTGMSVRTIDRTLKKLIRVGEIIVKGNYQFSVVTVCDYESSHTSESLFGSTDGISNGTTDGISNGTTTPINIKEDKNIIDNLISHSIPYKKERENNDVALEVKKRYNKEFSGILPPCIRLSTSTRIAVEECLRRFGLQSVDVVFAQIKTEQFSLGNNKTGFIANFTFIFTLKNYQQYLERAQLARQKQSQPQPRKSVGETIHHEPQQQPRKGRREFLMDWVQAESKSPSTYGQKLLMDCYESGELEELGIDWKP